MELGLQMEELTCYETVGGLCMQHEESMETSIPEYCPDMARIVDVVGQLCIREKMPSDDHLNISGDVKVTVLYTSEEVSGLRSLTLSVPFSCRMENKRLCEAESTWLQGRVLLVEAKAVTSRKLYVRVMPEITALCYVKTTRQLCNGTEEESSLRAKREEVTLNLLQEVSEKEFSFTQDAALDESVPEDILTYRLCPKIGGVQHVGSKLLVKGEMLLSALYRTEEQSLREYSAALPFSEIVDGLVLPEDAECSVEALLCDGEVRCLRTENGGGFSISARVSLLICGYTTRKIAYIADIYSTKFSADVQCEEVSVPEERAALSLVREAETRLEFGQKDPFLYVLALDCGPVSITQEEGKNQLRTVWRVKLLYLDDTGAPVCTERSEELCAEVENVCGGIRGCCWESEALFSGGVCQLRFPIVLRMRDTATVQFTAVNCLTLSPREKCQEPSLILRRMQPGEKLWDVAKQYQTDETLIREVNQWDGESELRQMLLIPKIR